MKFKSALLTEASGSLAGLTFSHNQAGMYIRARSVPINPKTPRQELVRSLFTLHATDWPLLGDAARAAWDTYALNTPLVDSIGRTLIVTGRNMFARSYVFYGACGVDPPADAPANFGLAMLTKPSLTWDEATQKVNIAFDNTDEWAGNSNGFLAYFVGRQVPLTRNYYAGPFTYLGKTNGAATPPTSPVSVSLPVPVSFACRVFMRFRAADADRRLSRDYIVSVVCTPAA